ncbi:uncharacterized protein [Dermacentor albipictus]|uniref:uncharacterized protein n=1 Tax=Dermacentor albipictus TaxID=60249 RepID=UPI0031FE034F
MATSDSMAGKNSPARSGSRVELSPSPPPTQPELRYAGSQASMTFTPEVTWRLPRGATTPCVKPSAFSTAACPSSSASCLWPAAGCTPSLAELLEVYPWCYTRYIRGVAESGELQWGSTAGRYYAPAPRPRGHPPFFTSFVYAPDDVKAYVEVAYQQSAESGEDSKSEYEDLSDCEIESV